MSYLVRGAWVLLMLIVIAGSARADLVSTLPKGYICGGDDFQGTQTIGTVTDKAGNIFTLFCVNKDYLQGEVFVKSTDKTTKFGRCKYPAGVNVINYEVDQNNNFADIEWVNVKPPTPGQRDDLQTILSNTDGDPTDKWLKRVDAVLKALEIGKDDYQIYKFPFSPNNQIIASFDANGNLVAKEVLTPDEANAAYLDDGLSPISDLVIDPLMRVPGASFQSEGTIPEPSTYGLFALGLLGILVFRLRARGDGLGG